MFALLLCKLCLRYYSLKNKIVGQLNLCVLLIRPYFVLQAFFFLEIEYLGTSFIFKMFYGLKLGAKTQFQNKLFTRTSIYKTIGI
jgi:hypothetical protein